MESAQKSVQLGPKVVKKSHPRGPRGTKISINEVVRRVEEGRKDPKTIAWARETVVKSDLAGFGADKMAQAQAILKRLRQERPYIEDPVDAEAIVSSACLLDGCKGLTFLGEDCDGLVVGFLSAVEAIGIEGAVVAHSYEKHRQHTHVLAAVYDRPNKKWIRCDPSTKQPFGIASKPTRETFYLVPGGKVIGDSMGPCDVNEMTAVYENQRAVGDFVGVGRPNIDSGQVGAQAEPVFPEVTEAFQAYMVAETRRMTEELSASWKALSIRHREYELVCEMLNENMLSTNWTENDEKQFQACKQWVPVLINYGNDVVDGRRKVAWDATNEKTVIVGTAGELAFDRLPDGKIKVTDTRSLQQVGTVGAAGPMIVVVVVAIVLYGIFVETNDASRIKLEEEKDRRNFEADEKARAAGVDPRVIEQNRMAREQLAQQKAIVDVSKEQASPLGQISRTAESVVTALGWIAAAGLGIYAISVAADLIKSRRHA